MAQGRLKVHSCPLVRVLRATLTLQLASTFPGMVPGHIPVGTVSSHPPNTIPAG